MRIAYIFPLSPILPWILAHRTTTFIPSPLFSQNPVKWDKLCKSFYNNRNHESQNSLNNIPNDCLASTMRVNQHARTMSSPPFQHQTQQKQKKRKPNKNKMYTYKIPEISSRLSFKASTAGFKLEKRINSCFESNLNGNMLLVVKYLLDRCNLWKHDKL